MDVYMVLRWALQVQDILCSSVVRWVAWAWALWVSWLWLLKVTLVETLDNQNVAVNLLQE